MCLAIPAKIIELKDNSMAIAQIGESQTFLTASTMLLPDPALVGDYVIIHAGFALQKLDPKDALDTLAMFREIAQTLEEEKTAKT